MKIIQELKLYNDLTGITAVYENGYVTICRGEWKMRLMKAENIPLTYGGKAKFMIQNVLALFLLLMFKELVLKI